MSFNIVSTIIMFLVATVAIYLLYFIILNLGRNSQLSDKEVLNQLKELFAKQQYELVELLATKYLERNPNFIEVRRYLARAYLANKKYKNAINQCDIILQSYPNDIEAQHILSQCYS